MYNKHHPGQYVTIDEDEAILEFFTVDEDGEDTQIEANVKKALEALQLVSDLHNAFGTCKIETLREFIDVSIYEEDY
jgi:hypothetical protein